jgi:hypothetical protein
MKRRVAAWIVVGCVTWSMGTCLAKVDFFEREEIDGVTLYRDSDDERVYRYLPPYPRLAVDEEGRPLLSFIRYVGAEDGTDGGLLNAVVEFTLPPETVRALERQLQKRHAGARVGGPVTFTDPEDDLEEGIAREATFEVVSAAISRDAGSKTLTSGSAPVGPGGRAVLAAHFEGDAAALLWASFQGGATSDVAFEINAAFLARIESFNAVVEAEMSTVYSHFSELQNRQGGFERDQVRDVVDSLVQNQTLSVRSSDVGSAFDLSSAREEKLVEVVTEKLVEVMFDVEAGWARPVEREVAVEEGQIEDRIEGGTVSTSFLGSPFGGSGEVGYQEHTEYVPDDQYVLKNRQDIRVNTFRMDLTRTQVVRVPYKTTGNIGGLWDRYDGDSRIFRVVDLDDGARQTAQVSFYLDSAYGPAFDDLLDSVVVDIRHGEGSTERNYPVRLSGAAFREGGSAAFETVELRRLGDPSGDWDEYAYRVRWYLQGLPEPILVPADGGWIRTQDRTPRISPPLTRKDVTVHVASSVLDAPGVDTVLVDVMSTLAGAPRILKTVRFAAEEEVVTMSKDVTIFHEPGAPVVSRVTFLGARGRIVMDPGYVESGEVFVDAGPPDAGEGE